MPRKAVIGAAIAALALTTGAASVGAMELATQSRLAGVRLVRCSHWDGWRGHSAVFYARMRRIVGTRRMALRYTLLQRTGDEPFHPVQVPGLHRWHRSRLGVAAYGFRQTVRNLQRGSSYRARIDFRWYGAGSTPILRVTRQSRICYEPGPLANLQVVGLGVLRGVPAADRSTYVAEVKNAGRAGAKAVGVSMSVDGSELPRQTIDAIAPGRTAEARFVGPRCASPQSSVTAVADPDDAIPEYSQRDNSLSGACWSIGGW